MVVDPSSAWSRRAFLRFLAGAGIAAVGSTASGCASIKPELRGPQQSRRVLADLHTHPSLNAWLKRTPIGVADPSLLRAVRREFNPTATDWKRLHRVGVDLVCTAHFNMFDEWLSMPTDPNPDAPKRAQQMIRQLEEILEGPVGAYAQIARTSKELRAILAKRWPERDYRVAVVHALEGGHALGGDPKQVAQLATMGVAIITVTHFFQKGLASSANAFPFFPDGDAGWAPTGLSTLGREVIRAMEDAGVVVDVTHATDHALADILAAARRPVIATHTASRTLSDHPYAMHDEHAQEIVKNGGLLGVILFPYLLSNYAEESVARREGCIRDVVRMIRHFITVCGTHRGIAIGSDFSGFIEGPKEMSDLGEVWKLREGLNEEFRDPAMVEDIMAGNAIRFLTTEWGHGR